MKQFHRKPVKPHQAELLAIQLCVLGALLAVLVGLVA